MGGLLAEPARYYPSVFATDGLFGEYPYLLPNLVAAGVVVLAIIQGIFLLEETNPRDKRNAQPNPPLVDERTSLLGNGRDHTVDTDADSIRALVVTDTMPAVDLLRADCILSHGAIVQTVEDDAAGGEEHENSKPLKMFNSNVIALSIALVLMSYHQMGFATIFPVYLLDSPSSSFSFMDLQGGLGLTVHDSGIYMAIDGMIAMFFQLVVLPPFIARIGVYRCVVSLTVLYCFPHVVMPFVSLLPDTLLSVGILTGLGLQAFCAVCMFPCLLIMLKNSLSDPKMLARVNGVALSGCCAARTLSPPLVGLIYSYLGSAAAWWSGTIVAGVAVLELYWIPNAETRPADEENGSTREMEQNT